MFSSDDYDEHRQGGKPAVNVAPKKNFFAPPPKKNKFFLGGDAAAKYFVPTC